MNADLVKKFLTYIWFHANRCSCTIVEVTEETGNMTLQSAVYEKNQNLIRQWIRQPWGTDVPRHAEVVLFDRPLEAKDFDWIGKIPYLYVQVPIAFWAETFNACRDEGYHPSHYNKKDFGYFGFFERERPKSILTF